MELTEKEIIEHLQNDWKISYDKSHENYKIYRTEGGKILEQHVLSRKYNEFCTMIKDVGVDKVAEGIKEDAEGMKENVAKTKPEEKATSSLPYPAKGKPPEDFFKEFVKEYPTITPQFVDIQTRRIKRRKALPHPQELASDLSDMPSGITNPRTINYIAEEYSYALKDYLREIGADAKPVTPFGVSIPEQKLPYYQPSVVDNIDHSRQAPSDGVSMKDFLIWQKEQEAYTLREKVEALKNEIHRPHSDENQQYLAKQIDELRGEIKKRDEDDRGRLRDEIEALKLGASKQQPITPTDIEKLIERTLEEREGRITPGTIKKIVQEQMSSLKPRDGGLTKVDLDFLLEKDRIKLEEKKLTDAGKSRDKIAEAIGEGVSTFGTALGKTLGQSSAPADETMLHIPCPECGTIITAPVGTPIVTCPKCFKKWTVGLPEKPKEEPPNKEEPPIPKDVEKIMPKPKEEEFTEEEKEKIDKSLEDAKKGKIKPLEMPKVEIPVKEPSNKKPKKEPPKPKGEKFEK